MRSHNARTASRLAREGLSLSVRSGPVGHRTVELALREFVTRQTRFDLGYVEQLYTFGDQGRDAPVADVGAGAARVISVGYLVLSAADDRRRHSGA